VGNPLFLKWDVPLSTRGFRWPKSLCLLRPQRPSSYYWWYEYKGGGQKPHYKRTISRCALVEKDVAYDIYNQEYANLSLKRSNLNTAINIQDKLNKHFDEKVAIAIDPRTIRLKIRAIHP